MGIRANGSKIFIESGLSDEFSHIGKGEVLSIVDSVTTLGSVLKVIGVNPSNSGRPFTVGSGMKDHRAAHRRCQGSFGEAIKV